MLIDNLNKKQIYNFSLILLISTFVLSLLFQSPYINAQIFNNQTLDTIENPTDNIDNNIKDIHQISLPLPTACVFHDGDSPQENPDDCIPIRNNEETLGSDNVFFTLNSSQSFDSFTCTLQDRDVGIVISTFDCTISHTVAEANFLDLEDGDYAFTVTAIRTISDNNPLTPDAIEEAASPPFNFRVGIGGDGGGFDEGNFRDQGPI